VNSLVTDEGTFEWEWYGSSTPAVPTVWKVRPAGPTEFSVGFDAVTGGEGSWHASDHVSFAATTALPSTGIVQWAVAPTVTLLQRTDAGIRAGALLLSKVEAGRHSLGFSASWSGATRPSDTNPAGLVDFGAGYGFGLGGHVTAHASATWERATGYGHSTTLAEGVEWQARRNFAMDVTVTEFGYGTGQVDHVVTGGITWNLGRIRRR
jgi:hypothetical protein